VPLAVFSALRLGLFVVALVLLRAVGMRGWLLVVVATVAAWAVSYALLTRQRDAAALWLADREARREAARANPRGIDADAAAEDAVEDAALGGRVDHGPPPTTGPIPQSDRPRPSSTP
jgi:hypothetical protein